MILELDMGNTRIKWRLRGESGKVARGSMSSLTGWPEFGLVISNAIANLSQQQLSRVLVASVLSDDRKLSFSSWCKDYFFVTPEFANSQAAAAGVTNGYAVPDRLGVDRWLAVLAGYNLARQSCVVIDCGSAITVDLVASKGVHLGGYIAPGLSMMRRALFQDTAGIVLCENLAEFDLRPGRDTEAAVVAAQSAMVVGLVVQAVHQLQQQDTVAPVLVVTGGDAGYVLAHFPDALLQSELVLDGLVLALQTNQLS